MKPTYLKIITLIIVICFTGCKATNSSDTQKSQGNSITSTDDIKLNPSEALVEIKVLEKKSNSYLVQVNELIKQSFGFSSYLQKGDSISISSNSTSIDTASALRIIIKESMSLGDDPVFDFRLPDQ